MLMKSIQERGPSQHHHHYHNAIVGVDDAEPRYNKKWMRKNHPDQEYLGDYSRG